MIILSNFGDLYIFSLVVGLCFSLNLLKKYNKDFVELNYNIKRYPLWMVSIFTFIIFILWLIIPISITKLLENEYNIIEKYNYYLNNSIKMSMSNLSDNASTTVRSNLQNPESIMEKEIAKGKSKSISTTNSITNTVSTSTDTEAGDGGVAKAMSSASLANKDEISVSQNPDSINENNSINTTTPLIQSPVVFANPSEVTHDEFIRERLCPNTETMSRVDTLKTLWNKEGICNSTFSSELSISSNPFEIIKKRKSMTHLNVHPSPNKIKTLKKAISSIFIKK